MGIPPLIEKVISQSGLRQECKEGDLMVLAMGLNSAGIDCNVQFRKFDPQPLRHATNKSRPIPPYIFALESEGVLFDVDGGSNWGDIYTNYFSKIFPNVILPTVFWEENVCELCKPTIGEIDNSKLYQLVCDLAKHAKAQEQAQVIISELRTPDRPGEKSIL